MQRCIATKGKFTQLSRSHNTTLVKGAEAEAKLRRNPLSCKMDEIKSEQFTFNLSAGLHKLWYPTVWDTSTWSKFGEHGEHGNVFLFPNLGAL